MKYDAVILAGGQSLRMGQDKGLMLFQHKPMVSWVASSLGYANRVWVNTNQYSSDYEGLGFQVVKDVYHEDIGHLAGPLLGILTGLQHSESDWVLFSPCDTPSLPAEFSEIMMNHASEHMSYANVAFDGERRQNLHLLLHRSLSENLMMFLLAGGRKTYQWLDRVKAQNVDFSDFKSGFKNINSPADMT